MTAVAQAWKAVVAFLLPGFAVLLNAALTDDPITPRVLIVALLTALVTSGAVYAVPNAASSDSTTPTPEPGV